LKKKEVGGLIHVLLDVVGIKESMEHFRNDITSNSRLIFDTYFPDKTFFA
jgi:hypothetical protein